MEAASERESGSSVGLLALASGEEESWRSDDDVVANDVPVVVLWSKGAGAKAAV